MASTLDYAPALGGLPYDPSVDGGGVDRLRLFTEPSRSGVPVVDVGPAVRIDADRWRFTYATPPDGTYFATVTWREAADAPAFDDEDQTIVLPFAARPPHLLVTGADLAAVVGNRIPRAALDQAATVISGLVEGHTRGRSVYPDDVPRDLAAVATAAALRLAVNLHQTPLQMGEQSVGAGFRGFSLAEQVVLNRYRPRTA